MSRSKLILLWLTLAPLLTKAQHRLVIHAEHELPKWLDNDVKLGSTEETEKACSTILSSAYRRGYLAASFDSCITNGTTTNCDLALGPQFSWADLHRGSMDVEIASAARFREKLYHGATMDPLRSGRMLERVLKWCENNGFPFAPDTS